MSVLLKQIFRPGNMMPPHASGIEVTAFETLVESVWSSARRAVPKRFKSITWGRFSTARTDF
jgi:hypothetical protein